MSRLKEGIIGPVLILFAICFTVGFLLSFTYSVTQPIIEANQKSAINEVVFAGMPDTSEFIELDAENLPDGVYEAFATHDGTYFVLKKITKGWGGPVTWFIALDAEGNYIYIRMGENTETPGLGNKVADQEYVSRYFGQRDPHAVDAVTGVTITTNSLRAALALANETFEMLKGE